MKTMDRDGLLLCSMQAKAFELSKKEEESSSEIFIRRFMNSDIAQKMDSMALIQTNLQPSDMLLLIEEEYGRSSYGSNKYSEDELYWIGYMYRYYAYTYELTSAQVYKRIKPKELRKVYGPYHTMDPAQAIDRILEAKGLIFDTLKEEMRQYEIYKRIRTTNI